MLVFQILNFYKEKKQTKVFLIFRVKGETEFRRVVPDSITSWVLTAFSLSDVHGLGLIKEPRKVIIYYIYSAILY